MTSREKTYLKIFCCILSYVGVAHDDDTPGEQACARGRLELEFVRAIISRASRISKRHVSDLLRRDDEPIAFGIGKYNPPTRLVTLNTGRIS
jgi:hypothetical protein